MNSQKILRPAVKRVICVLVLLCAVIVTARTSYIISDKLLDSDTSSELILAEKLAREGGIVAESWYYSTELQVIDQQLVYKFFFRFLSDWSTVRFLSTLTMQLMMLASFGFLARQARISFNRFCLAGAALLMPFSVPYGRIVLFHNYYAFHFIWAMLTVGSFLAVLRRTEKKGYLKRWPFWAYAAAMCAVSFTAGLGGVRQLMVCTVPLVASALLSAMVGERGGAPEEENRLRASLPAILAALAALAFSGAGYLVNLNVLAARYHFTDYSMQYMSLGELGVLSDIFRNLLITLGFRDYCNLFTLEGMLGIAGVLIFLVSLLLGLHTLKHTRDRYARFLTIFMFMAILVMVCVFMLLALENFRKELYFLPVIIWVLPALAKMDLREDSGAKPIPEGSGFVRRLLSGDAPLSVHGLLATLVTVLFLANGLYYTGFFRDPAAYGSKVEYNGLDYSEATTADSLRPYAEYLREKGYTLVYAPYWQGAVITELTDGEVKTVPVVIGSRKHPIKYSDWMGDQTMRDPAFAEQQKAAIFADYDIASCVEEDNPYGAVQVETLGGFTVFDMPDPAALARDLWD